MFYTLFFWISIVGMLVSWNMVLLQPEEIIRWFGVTLVSSSIIAWLVFQSGNWRRLLIDRLALVCFSIGVYWWLLMQDFAVFKYIFPVVIWLFVVSFLREYQKNNHIEPTPKLRYTLFFGGLFTWSTVAYGVVFVVGWQLWQGFLLFLIPSILFSYSAIRYVSEDSTKQTLSLLLHTLIMSETFLVLLWLPFTEASLSLIVSAVSLFSYDMLKYYADPDLVRKQIMLKKAVLYAVFIAVALITTPWH